MRCGAAAGVVAWALASCASGDPRGACDPSTTNCTDVPDASTIDAIDAPPDAPLRGFGEPCTDRRQCESNLCILTGTSGECTQGCGDCPTGYGCLGVTGVGIDGEVTFVCVRTSSQLCSPCTADTECTVLGMDKCVPYPDGDQFCGRDCTSVSCPTGFSCETVNIEGTNYKQCIAESNACDCDVSNPGAMQPCNIVTPWNVCVGSSTCGGASGWGACAPPSTTDDPDDAYADSNCDGIDGDMSRGIFVSTLGANSATCGLTYQTPCASITYGIRRAVTAGRSEVFVQTGTYNEVIVVSNGIDVWGGYDANWQRGAYSDPSHRVRVVGRLDDGVGGDNQYLTVRAHGVTVPTQLDNLVLEGPAAVGAGNSSYVVHVAGSELTLTHVSIVAGDGATGGMGAAGTNATSLAPAPNGGTGGDGSEQTACSSASGGAGGGSVTNTCSASPSSRNMTSGSGGSGGSMDTSCPWDLDARAGAAGNNASYVNGGYGTAGGGGPANSSGCNSGLGTPGGDGQPGYVANGGAGAAGSGGSITNGYWTGNSGGSGFTGENGGGGGGAGGSGGCDDGTDARGAGGGGGGAGGCAARSGGSGGSGGGGSFGVFVVGNSVVNITTCGITRGRGGTGGMGGAGGIGQPGGSGGPGGGHQGASAAGRGGDGGHGGHGGGGGGGAGGRSIGIVRTPGSTVTDDCTITAGTAGAGGAGGDTTGDGNDGNQGAAGALEERRLCASGTSC
jgi:hypothetical protein